MKTGRAIFYFSVGTRIVAWFRRVLRIWKLSPPLGHDAGPSREEATDRGHEDSLMLDRVAALVAFANLQHSPPATGGANSNSRPGLYSELFPRELPIVHWFKS